MDLNKYEVNRVKEREGVYWYLSKGGKGIIKKVVELQKMQTRNLYNLALADEIDGRISYANISDNKDTKKVLATIAEVVIDYTLRYPNRWIHITGDSKIKTCLYRIHISNNLEEIRSAGYIVLSFKEGEQPEEFKKNVRYDGFLVKRI